MSNSTPDSNNLEHDEFQNLLDSLSGLDPIAPGKRGGGRKATNNIGADILGVEMLNELLNNHHVDLTVPGNVRGNTLWGFIDANSVSRADQISMGIEPSYNQVGILAVSLAQTSSNEAVIMWWKGTVVNGSLSFQKWGRKGEKYRFGLNLQGKKSFWKVDPITNKFQTKNDGKDYIPFQFSRLVNFEEYLNCVVGVTEVPVVFPDGEINNLRGLTEILANVNLNAIVVETNSNNNLEDDLEFEDEEDEV